MKVQLMMGERDAQDPRIALATVGSTIEASRRAKSNVYNHAVYLQMVAGLYTHTAREASETGRTLSMKQSYDLQAVAGLRTWRQSRRSEWPDSCLDSGGCPRQSKTGRHQAG
jgi:hypothetical protein